MPGKIVLLRPTAATQLRLIEYAFRNGFETTKDFDGNDIPRGAFDFHITVIASHDSGIGVTPGLFPIAPITIKPSHLSTIGKDDTPAIFCFRTRELQELRERFQTGAGLTPTFDSFMPHISLSYHPRDAGKQFRDIPLPDFRLEFDRYEVKEFGEIDEALAIPYSEFEQYQKEAKAVLGVFRRYLQMINLSREVGKDEILIRGDHLGMTGELGRLVGKINFHLLGNHETHGGSMGYTDMRIYNMTCAYRKPVEGEPDFPNDKFAYRKDNIEFLNSQKVHPKDYGKILADRLTRLASLFAHEWTHHQQHYRDHAYHSTSDYPGLKHDGHPDNVRYFNHPVEIEAYISDILKEMDHAFLTRPQIIHTKPSTEEIIRWASGLGATQFWKNLSPANKKDVQGIVLQAYKTRAKAYSTKSSKKNSPKVRYESVKSSGEETIVIYIEDVKILTIEHETFHSVTRFVFDFETSSVKNAWSKTTDKIVADGLRQLLQKVGNTPKPFILSTVTHRSMFAWKTTIENAFRLVFPKATRVLVKYDGEKMVGGYFAADTEDEKARAVEYFKGWNDPKPVKVTLSGVKEFARKVVSVLPEAGMINWFAPISKVYYQYMRITKRITLEDFKKLILAARDRGLLRLNINNAGAVIGGFDRDQSETKDGPTTYYWVGDAKSYGRAVDAEPVGSNEFATRVKKIAAKLKPDENGLVLISRIYDAYARAFSDAGPLKAWKVRVINAKVDGYLELHPSSDTTTMTDSERERSRVIFGDSGFFYFIGFTKQEPKPKTAVERFARLVRSAVAKSGKFDLPISTAYDAVKASAPGAAKDLTDFKKKVAIAYEKDFLNLISDRFETIPQDIREKSRLVIGPGHTYSGEFFRVYYPHKG